MNGITGDIMSINYPLPYTYPVAYTHTWIIESSGRSKRQTTGMQKRIKLSIRDFTTEQCCDKVEVC